MLLSTGGKAQSTSPTVSVCRFLRGAARQGTSERERRATPRCQSTNPYIPMDYVDAIPPTTMPTCVTPHFLEGGFMIEEEEEPRPEVVVNDRRWVKAVLAKTPGIVGRPPGSKVLGRLLCGLAVELFVPEDSSEQIPETWFKLMEEQVQIVHHLTYHRCQCNDYALQKLQRLMEIVAELARSTFYKLQVDV